jgi:Tol biopolymer transport system component
MIHRHMCQPPVDVYGPPFGAFEGTAGDGDVNVYRVGDEDPPGDATRITDWNDGGLTVEGVHDPALSPDETLIAFIGVPVSSSLGALYVVGAEGGTATLLESDASTWVNHPMWSPDGTTIVFSRGNGAGNVYGGTVETIPAAGGSPTVLFTPSGSDKAYRPAYSYDGTRIAFMLEKSGADELWVMDADGSPAASIATITAYRLDGPQVGWAPSADRLVFENGSGEVRIINGDGTGSTKINLGAPDGADNRVGRFTWTAADKVVIASNQGLGYFSLYECDDDGVTSAVLLNASHGSANQAYMRQPQVYHDRVWFIEVASNGSGGMLASVALDGTDYIEELDVNDATLLDDFSGGNGFHFQ